MKKIISIIMITLVGITIIPKTLTNERHIVLESTTSVYTKEEVDNLLSAIRTNITNNTNELTNIKSELTTLQNSLKDYALKTSLNATNSNIDDLNTVVTNNTARIEALENNQENTLDILKNQGYDLPKEVYTLDSYTQSTGTISFFIKTSDVVGKTIHITGTKIQQSNDQIYIGYGPYSSGGVYGNGGSYAVTTKDSELSATITNENTYLFVLCFYLKDVKIWFTE